MKSSIAEVKVLKGEIQNLLLWSNSRTVATTLSSALDNSSEAKLRVIQKLLSKLIDDSKKELHCVRCHETFTKNRNSHNSCEIEHEFDEARDRIYRHWEGWTTVMNCCGHEVENDNFPDGFCSVSAHTTHASQVGYYDPKEGTGNSGIVPCSVKGCLLKEGDVESEDSEVSSDEEEEEDEENDCDSHEEDY
jgi:hypothetical protein